MVYINIPFVPENKRISRDLTQKELETLDISDDAKENAFEAIYNRLPRGVLFAEQDLPGEFTRKGFESFGRSIQTIRSI